MDESSVTTTAARSGTQLAKQAPKTTELERQFQLLTTQTDLLRVLDDRLNPVSHRAPTDSMEKPDLGNHISTSNYAIEHNNDTIRRLLEELAV